jgi:AcrR family transcriptional regulator
LNVAIATYYAVATATRRHKRTHVKKQEQRERVLAIAVEFVTEVGFGNLTFRTLARRAGTSDRMLLYYFSDKRELVTAILGVVSARFRGLLVDVPEEGRVAPNVLLIRAANLFESPEARPLALVWLELAALSQREPEVYGPATTRIHMEWATWLDARLAVPDPSERAAAVEALLTICDGLLVQGLVGDAVSVRRALHVLSDWAEPRTQRPVKATRLDAEASRSRNTRRR